MNLMGRVRNCAAMGLMFTASCGSSDEMSAPGPYSSDSYRGGAGSVGGGTSTNGTNGTVAAGQLTAADWDDNLNFGFYQSYLAGDGAAFASESLPTGDRVTIRVTNENGAPISNARVAVSAGGTVRLDAPTASDGRLLFFPRHDGASGALTVTITPPSGSLAEPVMTPAPSGTDWQFTLQGAAEDAPVGLDLAFVVDTTGSMGDELQYLKSEIANIAGAVASQHPDVSQRYALVVYRDTHDVYVTRDFDFTADLSAFQAEIDRQSADGGGDYPEAVDVAVADATQLTWRDGNVARIAFLVGDAPPHTGRGSALLAQADVLRRAGVKLYPVAASGVDDRAEFLFRAAAEWTLARYLFITDDSGIGNSHAEPHIPCYEVTLLNELMTRTIRSELGGRYIPPAADDVIRTAGNPIEGTCTLSNGSTVRLY